LGPIVSDLHETATIGGDLRFARQVFQFGGIEKRVTGGATEFGPG
jgi:hypothetical protein